MYSNAIHFVIYALVAGVMTAGCTNFVPLPEVEKPLVETDVVIDVSQEALGVVRMDGSSQPGVLNYAVNAMIAGADPKRAAEETAPIREMLKGHSLGEVFGDKISKSPAYAKLAGNAVPELLTSIPDGGLYGYGDRDTLRLMPVVELSNDYRTLMVRLELYLRQEKSEERNLPTEVSQAYEFAYPSVPLNELAGREKARAAWLEWTGEDLIKLIETGMDNVIDLWEFHMRSDQLPSGGDRHSTWKGRAEVIAVRDDILWLKSSNGKILFATYREVLDDR